MTDLKNIYSQELVKKAFHRLQVHRASDSVSSDKLWTILEGPELIGRDFLTEFLVFNYMMASDCTEKGSSLMGEFGGVVIAQGIERILAISQPSLNKLYDGFDAIKDAERQGGNASLIKQMEAEIEMPLIYRNDVTIVNGNRNVAHYDFTTAVYHDDPTEIISTNLYLLLAASGFRVISNKHLPNEQYVFGIPIDQQLLHILGSQHGQEERQLKIIESKKGLIPEDFLAGFHILYAGNTVKIRPLIVDSDFEKNREWIYGSGLEATDSGFAYLGSSDGYGRLTAVIEPGALYT